MAKNYSLTEPMVGKLLKGLSKAAHPVEESGEEGSKLWAVYQDEESWKTYQSFLKTVRKQGYWREE